VRSLAALAVANSYWPCIVLYMLSGFSRFDLVLDGLILMGTLILSIFDLLHWRRIGLVLILSCSVTSSL
jgi:cytochrome c oxidase subunit IV